MTTYPARLDSRLDAPLSRWLWLVKWLLLIPHYIVLAFLSIAFLVVTIVAFFAILITGRYPRSLFDFNVGVMRWWWRVSYFGYSALGTDRYPPFTLAEVPDYPATLEVDYPSRLSRGLVLVKWWLLAIPHYIIIAIFAGGSWLAWRSDDWQWSWGSGGLVGILVLVSAIILAVTGSYPRPLFDFILGMDRWVLRATAYAALMTDQYPPFRLDMGENDPGQPVGAGSQPTPIPPPAGSGSQSTPISPAAGPGSRPGSAFVAGSTAGATAGGLPPGPAPSHSRWTPGRIVSLVLGCVFALTSAGLLVAGGGLLFADRVMRVDGYVTSDTTRLASNGHAVVSSPVDLNVEGPDWPILRSIFGDVRIRATAERRADEVFLGIAPAGKVDRYLKGVAYAEVASIGADTSSTERIGQGPPSAPTERGFWAAQVSGSGTQSLTWTPVSGTWDLVAMNADGSRPVEVQADIGATVPALTWVAVGLLVLGALFLALGIALIVGSIRRASRASPR